MKPLIILLTTFIVSLFAIKFLRNYYDFPLSGRIAMAVMLMFTALGHFKFPAGMSMMLPEFIPYKIQIIYITGVLEILGGITLLIHPLYKTDAWLLILFFISILPANIYAAIHHINLEKADKSGSGIRYLWFRIPLQLFFISWIWFFALYKG